MKQNIWCWGDDYLIRDETGQDRFFVDGRAFSLGDKLSFQDLEGNELAHIEQRLLSWGATYEIHRPGLPVTEVKKELFTFLRCKFTVDGPGNDDYEARGDFLDHEYELHGPRGLVACISKRWFSISDHYGIEVAESEDVIQVLATAVVIDLVCHDKSKRK